MRDYCSGAYRTEGELKAVCENQHISSGFYTALITCNQYDPDATKLIGGALPDDRFRRIVEYLRNNPRVGIARGESAERHYRDGMSHIKYDEFYLKCWRLSQLVPPSQIWADTLYPLYERLHSPFNPFDDVGEVLGRWRIEDVDDDNAPSVWLRQLIVAGLQSELGKPPQKRR